MEEMIFSKFYMELQTAWNTSHWLRVRFSLVPGGVKYCIVDNMYFGAIMGADVYVNDESPIYRFPSFSDDESVRKIENNLRMLGNYHNEEYTGKVYVESIEN